MPVARNANIPVIVDPKGVDYQKYSGAFLIKPNRAEMTEFARRWGWSDNLVEAAKTLRKEGSFEWVALTLGEEGMVLIGPEETTRIAARAQEVFDVTGAGDTVIATLALGIGFGLSPVEAAELANHAAAIAISRVGSTAVTAEELEACLMDA
jgi:rfaE bifunctional protein kinase chain/domain